MTNIDGTTLNEGEVTARLKAAGLEIVDRLETLIGGRGQHTKIELLVQNEAGYLECLSAAGPKDGSFFAAIHITEFLGKMQVKPGKLQPA